MLFPKIQFPISRIFLALLIAGITCGMAHAETHQSSALDASFDVPAGWRVKEFGGSETINVFVSPENPDGSQPRKWTTFSVMRRSPGVDGYPVPKDLAEAVAETIRAMNTSDEYSDALPHSEISEEDVQFAGMPSKKLSYISEPGAPQERKAVSFLVLKDGFFFSVSFLCETHDYEQDWPGANQLFESFKFN